MRATGFDVLLGNPPWERVKLQEKEWFASRSEAVATAPNAAARREEIRRLESEDPDLHRAFLEARREAEGMSQFLRQSGRFPLCGRGDVNLYTVFAEHFRDMVGPRGRSGCMVPSGIATDDTTKFYFQSIVEERRLASLYDFENALPLFPGVHRSYKFSALTLSGSAWPMEEAEFCFFAHRVEDLADEDRRFTLSAEDIALVNPNTRTCPVFRTRRDAEITKGIYRRVPVLVDETREDGNPWGVRFSTMFHMSNDSGLFRTREQLEPDGWALSGNVFERGEERMLPLYEAKMIHHYDHRWATYEDGATRLLTEEEKADPSTVALPRYWVPEAEVDARLAKLGWEEDWLLGWRDICRSTDERTVIGTAFPRCGVGNNLPVWSFQERACSLAVAALSSFALDFVARFKVGGVHLNFFIAAQLPVPAPEDFRDRSLAWLEPAVDWLLQDPAGDPERRRHLRAEIDAAMFHLYGIERDDVDYILDTFPIVRRKDEQRYGSYRTKELILEYYDRMAECRARGEEYQPDWPDQKAP